MTLTAVTRQIDNERDDKARRCIHSSDLIDGVYVKTNGTRTRNIGIDLARRDRPRLGSLRSARTVVLLFFLTMSLATRYIVFSVSTTLVRTVLVVVRRGFRSRSIGERIDSLDRHHFGANSSTARR